VPLYVLALTDVALGTWTVDGRRLHCADYDRIHAVHERRGLPPALSDDELRAQHRLVVAIAQRASAVLPARFGSLLDRRELTAAVTRHEQEILAALARVHHHVQMTVRILGERPKSAGGAARANMSGREYLERARLAATPPTTGEAERLLARLSSLVASERREHGAGRLLATIYHLVHVRHVDRYKKVVGAPDPGVIVSGPWPPFAFSPQLW
jgi:hypothetical protein